MLSRREIKTEIKEFKHIIDSISKQVVRSLGFFSPGDLFLSIELYNNHERSSESNRSISRCVFKLNTKLYPFDVSGLLCLWLTQSK